MLMKRCSKQIAAGFMAATALLTAPGWSGPRPLPSSAHAAEVRMAHQPTEGLALSLTASRLATQAALAAQTVALPENQYGVRVNGLPLTQDPLFTAVNGATYVSLRTMVQALLPQAAITWDGHMAQVSLPGVLALYAEPGLNYIVANDRYLYLPQGVLAQNGAILLPLETVVKALDATYVWQPDGTLDLTAGSGGILPGDSYYNADDLYWLSHIIYAESGNQPLTGKIAVGNVVLNRVRDARFPDSVYGVVFQRSQFTPAATGTVYHTPNQESVLAAKLCLDGGVALDDVLYFNQAGLNCWAARNRTYVATIAGHTFYA